EFHGVVFDVSGVATSSPALLTIFVAAPRADLKAAERATREVSMSGSTGLSAHCALATTMQSVRRALVATCLLAASSGCVSPWTIGRLHSDLASLRKQVA